MTYSIAIMGDNFMLSSVFKNALHQRFDNELLIQCLDLPFPNTPVTQRSSEEEFIGLREFQGTSAQVVELIGSASAFITHLAPMTRQMLEKLPALEFVAVSRGGPVNVDMHALRERGVKVVNTPGRNASAVAEFTVGAIIAETRNIARAHADAMRGVWRGDLYRHDLQRDEVSSMTVGIVGYSAIGRRVAHLLNAFGSKIIFYDPYTEPTPEDTRAGIQQVSLETLLSEADCITLHARLTDETQNMIDGEALQKMKPGALLVNTARGELIDEDALCHALQNRSLSGAVLDTFATEPWPHDSPLLKLDNVTLTSHIAGASKTTAKVAATMVAEELYRHLNGLPALNPC